jgi:muramoyltetrapeptide carboxypeptidase
VPLKALRAVRPLLPGARVALVAPAGGLRGEEDIERAIRNARGFGWEPVVGANAVNRDAYFAGTDRERLTDLNRALSDRSIDGVWCIRGGYGTMRLLPDVNFPAMKESPKPLIGFSDITALHCAVQRTCGIVCYHGPVARAALPPFSRDSLQRAVIDQTDPCGEAAAARTLRPGRATGILAGGNLAVLTALTGTPYAPVLDGAILVLEDVDERTYRVDRMLRQLYLAGALEGCRGIVFGVCTGCDERAESGSRSLDEVLREMADLMQIPCIAGAPVGHVDDQWTVPLGAIAHLDADERTLNVVSDQER